MSKVLILYASKKGSTEDVAHFIAEALREVSIEVDCHDAAYFEDDIHEYDAVILGTGIYKGLWLQPLWLTVRRLFPQFKQKPVWGFSLCIRVLEAAGEDYAFQHYLPHDTLQELNLQEYRFFAGRVEDLSPEEVNILGERYDGEYGHRRGDFRNWSEIKYWANRIAKKLNEIESLKLESKKASLSD